MPSSYLQARDKGCEVLCIIALSSWFEIIIFMSIRFWRRRSNVVITCV